MERYCFICPYLTRCLLLDVSLLTRSRNKCICHGSNLVHVTCFCVTSLRSLTHSDPSICLFVTLCVALHQKRTHFSWDTVIICHCIWLTFLMKSGNCSVKFVSFAFHHSVKWLPVLAILSSIFNRTSFTMIWKIPCPVSV